MTKAEIEAQVRADYAAAVGTSIERKLVMGYNGRDDSVDVDCDPPARLRVLPTSDDDLIRWQDEHDGDWCDPCWNVEPTEPCAALDGIRSLWAYATSYQEGTGKSDPGPAL